MPEFADKKRINEYLESYWEKLRGKRPYPTESEVNIDDLVPVWDSCFLVRVEHGHTGHGYTYTFLGKSLIEAFGGDDVSDRVTCEELVYPSNVSLIRKFDEVLSRGTPVDDESEFVNRKGMTIKYRSSMLPLGDGTGRIGFIIGGMKWKSF